MTQWFVFQTAPQREVQSARILRQHGIETIVLMEQSMKRRHRKHKVASKPDRPPVPSMRGYIFLDMSSGDAWARLHGCPVTVRPVGIQGRPPRPLSLDGVEYITEPPRGCFHDTDAPAVRCLDDNAPLDYGVGDCVKIQDGPFQGFEGPVASITGRQASVLLVLFAREVKATVSVGSAVRAVA
jgi:transcription antitermination factor NusG